MAKYLSAGTELPLSLPPGRILALKSTKLDLMIPNDNDWASVSPRVDLDLCNIDNDIILRITILRGTNKVLFNDHANKSLLDGWGQEKSVELSQVDVDRWQRSGVTISVHNCPNPFKEHYRILFDLTTMCRFDKHFPGPPIKINYSTQRSPHDTSDSAHGILSDPLKVFTYDLDDLPLMERQALNSGGAKFKPNPPWALIRLDDWSEMRIYYLDHGNVLNECAYDASQQWKLGSLRKLKIILDPTSSITAVCRSQEFRQEIHIFYQDPHSDFIRQLSRYRLSNAQGPKLWEAWKNNILVTKALKGSSIAAVSISDTPTALHVFYQDPELRVRNIFMRTLYTGLGSGPSREWYHGFLDSGIQPHGTPLTVEPVRGLNDSLRLNVTWTDEQGHILSAISSDLSSTDWRWYLSHGDVQQGHETTQASLRLGTTRSPGLRRVLMNILGIWEYL